MKIMEEVVKRVVKSLLAKDGVGVMLWAETVGLCCRALQKRGMRRYYTTSDRAR